MRKVIVISMISLDGVIQGPGAPDEDPSNGFKYGGWVAPYSAESDRVFMQKFMHPSDLLLGRKTFEIWENYWPEHEDLWPGINEMKKNVVSTSRKNSDWNGSVFIESVAEIKKLKASEGSEIKVWGSSKLVQTLLKNDLVDELWLLTYPVTLGKGKKLFDETILPAAFSLMESKVTSSGVIVAGYMRAGEVKTGTVSE